MSAEKLEFDRMKREAEARCSGGLLQYIEESYKKPTKRSKSDKIPTSTRHLKIELEVFCGGEFADAMEKALNEYKIMRKKA